MEFEDESQKRGPVYALAEVCAPLRQDKDILQLLGFIIRDKNSDVLYVKFFFIIKY